MSTLHVNLIGRFGNQMFQYAYARALAEREGWNLITSTWVGQDIFDLPPSNLLDQDYETLKTEYHQDQDSLIYTRKQVKEWFVFKPEVEKKLYGLSDKYVACHRRVGDYAALGYVVVSKHSYIRAAEEYGYGCGIFVGEDNPTLIEGLPDFLPDFYLMTKRTSVLFRGNSTFSWWAATLGDSKVYSPVIEGLEGGKEQDCKFVEGNWPRFANLPFVTDLHLEEG